MKKKEQGKNEEGIRWIMLMASLVLVSIIIIIYLYKDQFLIWEF